LIIEKSGNNVYVEEILVSELGPSLDKVLSANRGKKLSETAVFVIIT
jgi:hypothetical protein